MEKVWKKELLTFEQFKDMWEQNNNLEVAKGLLTTLKDSESILLGQKLIFLAKLSRSADPYSQPWWFTHTSEDNELGTIAVRFFLDIMPRWDNNAFKKECEIILRALGNLSAGEQRGWENKIKVFTHSLLDTRPKEDSVFWEYYVPKALVNNRMFEEMVNYNFSSNVSIDCLWMYLFGEGFEFWPRYGLGSEGMTDAKRAQYKFDKLSSVLKENREPHAVSVLLRLLAKRGDLDNIFSASAETK